MISVMCVAHIRKRQEYHNEFFEGKHERNKLLGRTTSRWPVILEYFQVFKDFVNLLAFFWVYALCGMRVVRLSSQTSENTCTTQCIKAKYNPYQNWSITGCNMRIFTGFMWFKINTFWAVFRTWVLLEEEYIGQMNSYQLIDVFSPWRQFVS